MKTSDSGWNCEDLLFTLDPETVVFITAKSVVLQNLSSLYPDIKHFKDTTGT